MYIYIYIYRGSLLSDATCLTHDFFKRGELRGKL